MLFRPSKHQNSIIFSRYLLEIVYTYVPDRVLSQIFRFFENPKNLHFLKIILINKTSLKISFSSSTSLIPLVRHLDSSIFCTMSEKVYHTGFPQKMEN